MKPLRLEKYKARREPVLKDYKGDLSKQWYINYWVYNTDTEGYERKFLYIENLPTVAKRRKAARILMADLKKALKAGYMTGENAYDNEEDRVFDVDLLTYRDAYIYFLNLKNGTLEGWTTSLHPSYSPDSATIKESTYRAYKGVFEDFYDWMKKKGMVGMLLKSISPNIAREYALYLRKTRKLSPKRCNVMRDHLSSIWNHFTRKEDLPLKNPFAKVEKLKEMPSEAHPPFAPDQLKAITDYCNERVELWQLQLFCRFIYYTLARPYEEIGKLQVRDIGTKHITIRAENQKNSIARKIDIPPALEEEIKRFRIRSYPKNYYVFGSSEYGLVNGSIAEPAETYRSDSSFYRQHKKMLEALKLENYTLYGYKHTGAIAVYRASKDIIRVRDMCGHTTVATTEIYLRGIGAFENEVVNVERF